MATALTETERSAYQRHRAEGFTARGAFNRATEDRGGPDVPHLDGGAFERDGFQLTVRLIPDQYLTPEELANYGTYLEDEQDGCLDRAKEDSPYYRPSQGESQYFLPAWPLSQRLEAGQDPERAAWEIRHDFQRAEAFGWEWHYIVVRIVVSKAGIELGSSTISGVEDDSGDRHIREMVDETADEAICEAQEALAALLEACRPKPVCSFGHSACVQAFIDTGDDICYQADSDG